MHARRAATAVTLLALVLAPGAVAARSEIESSAASPAAPPAPAPATVTDPAVAPRWMHGRRAARRAILARPLAALLVLVTLAALVVAACGDPGRAVAGIVVAVDAPAGEVTGFTLRTQRGETITFDIGTLEIDGAAFAASHLVEHAVTLQPIAVAYRVEDGANVVYRMVDAPWAAPSS